MTDPAHVRWQQLDGIGAPRTTGEVAPAAETAEEVEDRLRARLGLRPLAERVAPSWRVWSWVGPLVVTVLAGVLRLVDLNHPTRLIFDETYYVKQAYSLLTLGYEGEWADESDAAFAAGDYSGLSTTADYVVHPQVGKWMIAVGLRLFGADNGAGWRVAGAVTGTLAVLLLCRVAIRLFGSPLLGTVAGLLLAVDGMHLTGSRTALLDSFLMFWVLVGFWAVLRDRDATRAVLARRAAAELARDGRLRSRWGPATGLRWWLVVAGVALGLACGVKWSGAYAIAVLGVLVFAWDTAARRAVGVRGWLAGGVLRGGAPAFVALVPTAAVVYVLGWFSWFTHDGAYLRQWAADERALHGTVDRAWLPEALNSWWEYHLRMWDFHNGLESEHSYAAHPAGWIVQWRPTSFYWADDPPQTCGADRCVEAITSLGNPLVWWLGCLALVLVVWTAARHRDWRAWAILAGFAALYLPWFGYAHRTIFQFYAVAFAPFVVLALTYALGWATALLPGVDRRPTSPPEVPRRSWVLLTAALAAVLALAAFYWPVWTGANVSYELWRAHMWLPSWI